MDSTPQTAPSTPDVLATAPGQLKVIKRNGTVVPYTDDKIIVAITKAFLAVEGAAAAASGRIHQTAHSLNDQIGEIFKRRMPSGGTVHIEDIQDQVELALMRSGEQKIARAYVIYREQRTQERLATTPAAESEASATQTEYSGPSIRVTYPDGTDGPLDMTRLHTIVNDACADLNDVDADAILNEALRNLYDGVSIEDVNTALVITARTLVEKEPNYTYATARLLMDSLRREALSFLKVATSATQEEMAALYPATLKAYVHTGIELELISPELAEYDLDVLGKAIKAERDLQFAYLGLQTLYDRYFIHSDADSGEIRFELPQCFFMRVAMGLAAKEEQREARAIEFYNLLSSFDYMSSTPTLFNAGTLRPQLSSCYLTTVPNDLEIGRAHV